MEIAIKNEMLIPTKSELKEMATQLTEGVANGFDDALRVFGQLSALAEVIEQAKNIVKPMAIAEAEKYEGGGKDVSAYGCDFQVKEAGVKYDYSGNEYWQQLKEARDVADAELKGHETTLRKIGEYSKTSTTTLVVNLRK